MRLPYPRIGDRWDERHGRSASRSARLQESQYQQYPNHQRRRRRIKVSPGDDGSELMPYIEPRNRLIGMTARGHWPTREYPERSRSRRLFLYAARTNGWEAETLPSWISLYGTLPTGLGSHRPGPPRTSRPGRRGSCRATPRRLPRPSPTQLEMWGAHRWCPEEPLPPSTAGRRYLAGRR